MNNVFGSSLVSTVFFFDLQKLFAVYISIPSFLKSLKTLSRKNSNEKGFDKKNTDKAVTAIDI